MLHRLDWMADLLDQLALVDWLPEETLFSLASRLHHFWGMPLARQTCSALFMHPQQGSQHDLPSRLATFVSQTNGRYGTVVELARARTLLSYYLPFKTEQEVEAAVASMAASNVAHLKLRLGILTSRFRAHHPLKACPHCIQEDVERHGWSYWHLPHQFPGVWVCLKHMCRLHVSSLKATGVGRFHWVLPRQSGLRMMGGQDDLVAVDPDDAALGLARLITDITTRVKQGGCATNVLSQVYRARLAELGWMRAGASLRWPEISESYCGYVRALVGCSDVPEDMQDQGRVVIQLGRMLRSARSGTHPLRHHLIIHWLFKDFAAFADAVRRHSGRATFASDEERMSKASSKCGLEFDVRQRLLRELLSTDGYTLTGAARTIGIDVATAMAWAAKMGISVSGFRRPKKLKHDQRLQALVMLRHGSEKSEVAKAVGVSTQTVTRLLLTEVGLHEEWRNAKLLLQRDRCRATWSSLVANYGSAGAKILRAMEPAVFAWLYRNDRDWLSANKPLVNRKPGGERRVDWDSRDRTLSQDVRVVADRLGQSRPGELIKLWQVYQELPELKAKLSALDRLPLTRKVLEDLISTRRKMAANSLV